MKKNLFLFFVSYLAILFSYSQSATIKEENTPFIEVTGTAEKEVIPDEIYIAIIIRERYVNKEKISIEAQEEKLKSAIKSLGINLNDLSLSDANADFVKIRWQKKDVLTKKDYTLKVSTATTVGQVFLELEKLQITDAYVSRVDHSKMDSLRKEVKITAIKAAKEKADYLLKAIGEQTGKPLIIKENEVLGGHRSNVRGVVAQHKYGRSDSENLSEEDDKDIEFQKINIQTSIYVKFTIK
jgi:uncharacterized protein